MRTTLLLVSAAMVIVTGCAAIVEPLEPGDHHPANSDAAAAPVMLVSPALKASASTNTDDASVQMKGKQRINHDSMHGSMGTMEDMDHSSMEGMNHGGMHGIHGIEADEASVDKEGER
jgi:uncharacterized protein involved in copper resistance